MTLWALPAMVVVVLLFAGAVLACLRPPRRPRTRPRQPTHCRVLPERRPYDQDA